MTMPVLKGQITSTISVQYDFVIFDRSLSIHAYFSFANFKRSRGYFHRKYRSIVILVIIMYLETTED